MKYCPNCGKAISNDPKFCPECGKSIKGMGESRITSDKRTVHEHEDLITQPSGLLFCKTCGKYIDEATGKTMDLNEIERVVRPDAVKAKPQGFLLFKVFAPIVIGVGVYFYVNHYLNTVDIPQPANTSAAVSIGFPQEDGQLTFVAESKLQCGIQQIGSDGDTLSAQGQFCKIKITITNHSSTPSDGFDVSAEQLVDASGSKYEASDQASIYTNDTTLDLASINPGNSVTGYLYFDVPKDANPSYLEVHDSSLSNGADILLK